MFDQLNPRIKDSLLALQYPKISLEYIKGMNKFRKYDYGNDIYRRKKVSQYIKLKENKDIPTIITSRDFKKASTEISFSILRFTEFYKAYQVASDSIKPVMLYYGMQYLFSSISIPLLKFDNPVLQHGIKVQKGNLQEGNPETIIIKKYGHFPRTVDAFYILDFESNLFSLDSNIGIQTPSLLDFTSQTDQ